MTPPDEYLGDCPGCTRPVWDDDDAAQDDVGVRDPDPFVDEWWHRQCLHDAEATDGYDDYDYPGDGW